MIPYKCSGMCIWSDMWYVIFSPDQPIVKEPPKKDTKASVRSLPNLLESCTLDDVKGKDLYSLPLLIYYVLYIYSTFCHMHNSTFVITGYLPELYAAWSYKIITVEQSGWYMMHDTISDRIFYL